MACRFLDLTCDATDPGRLGRFWAAVLHRELVQDGDDVVLPGSDTQVGLRFSPGAAPERGPAYLHLHLTSTTAGDQAATVAAALELGAHHLDVGQRPEEGHIVLADPEGNAFCVIEPGNAYLAGTGFLGELACDGSRRVGLFWRDALAWPLVWDSDEETAVQSPLGGTKVAWGGESPDSFHGRNRQQFRIGAIGGDVESEVRRLLDFGAAHVPTQGGDPRLSASPGASVVRLTDPDGREFLVVPA